MFGALNDGVTSAAADWIDLLQKTTASDGGGIIRGLICLAIAVASAPSHATAVAAALAQDAHTVQQQQQQQTPASGDVVSGAIGYLGWFLFGVQKLTAGLYTNYHQHEQPAEQQQQQQFLQSQAGPVSSFMLSWSALCKRLSDIRGPSCTLVLVPPKYIPIPKQNRKPVFLHISNNKHTHSLVCCCGLTRDALIRCRSQCRLPRACSTSWCTSQSPCFLR